jgi:hypothetical protein
MKRWCEARPLKSRAHVPEALEVRGPPLLLFRCTPSPRASSEAILLAQSPKSLARWLSSSDAPRVFIAERPDWCRAPKSSPPIPGSIPSARANPSDRISMTSWSEDRLVISFSPAELFENVLVISEALEGSEDLSCDPDFSSTSRELYAGFSSRFAGPEGPLSRSENPTSSSYGLVSKPLSPGISFPSTYSNVTSDQRRACLTRLCCVFRFSQPLDALFRSRPFSLVSC